jgi:hypothetical protein
LIGVLLLPVCLAGIHTLQFVAGTAGDALTVWIPLACGCGCWLVVFLCLPQSTWLYVVGHELTHVVWSWGFGGKLKKFKANSKGGYVILTKSNFLIALAPYFFPLYAMIVVAIFAPLNTFWPKPALVPVFHLLLGATYAFHITWTWEVIRTEQSDITNQGYLFSAAVIALGNLLILVFGIAFLAGKPNGMEVVREWGSEIGRNYVWLWNQVASLTRLAG